MTSTVEETADMSEHALLQKEVMEMKELIAGARAQFNLLPFFKAAKRRISEVEKPDDAEESQKKLKLTEESAKEVDNQADLMSRLSSFSFLYHYLPRPLTALECAKHGWRDTRNVVEEDDHICVLACSHCHNEMFVIDVDLDKADPLKAPAIQSKYKAGLYSCHKEDCIWRHDQCSDKVYSLPIYSLSEGVDRFEGEAKKIIAACEKTETALPQIKHQLDDKTLSKIDYFATKNENPTKQTAYILSLYGWKSLNEDIPGVQCDLCFMRKAFSQSEENESFDVLEEHKLYCPWINAKTAQAYTPKTFLSSRNDTISGFEWMKDVISMEYSLLNRKECLSLSAIHAADEKYHDIKYKMFKSYDLLKEWKKTIEKLENTI